jgi:serine protease Do
MDQPFRERLRLTKQQGLHGPARFCTAKSYRVSEVDHMKLWKWAALVAALVTAGGLGAAFAPPVRGQSTRVTAPRALEVLSGRGSQIGVSVRDVEEDDAKTGKLLAPGGVVIEDVAEESPAARAGFRKGDIVVEFDGERVRSVRQFTRLVHETPAGRKIQASLVRSGQRMNVTVEPRESNAFNLFGGGDDVRVLRDFARGFDDFAVPPARPARPTPPEPPVPPAFPDFQNFVWRSGNNLGLTVGELSRQLAEYFGTKDGALVTSVYDDSAAAKAGIKAGDVITSFNGAEVNDPSDLRRRIQRLQIGDEFTVGVVRDKKPLTLKGKIETTRNRRTYRSDV